MSAATATTATPAEKDDDSPLEQALLICATRQSLEQHVRLAARENQNVAVQIPIRGYDPANPFPDDSLHVTFAAETGDCLPATARRDPHRPLPPPCSLLSLGGSYGGSLGRRTSHRCAAIGSLCRCPTSPRSRCSPSTT